MIKIEERILHRDASILVLDKPAGMAVHKGPKGGVTLDQHFPDLQFGLPSPPQLAHRLDKDTSGCLVLGRHPQALRRLGEMFAGGEAKKTYWAIVVGTPASGEGEITLPLARRSHDRRSWWMKADPKGDPATTLWRVLGRGDGISWLELTPLTGRTHQLRVHCAETGWPIAGDRVYGGDRAKAASRHMQLHARAITLPFHPKKPPVTVTAPPPDHMHTLLRQCGWQAENLQ